MKHDYKDHDYLFWFGLLISGFVFGVFSKPKEPLLFPTYVMVYLLFSSTIWRYGGAFRTRYSRGQFEILGLMMAMPFFIAIAVPSWFAGALTGKYLFGLPR